MELYNGNIVTQPSSNNHSKVKVCPYCGQSSQTVFVHGHEQCVVCKTNVEPCCQGQDLMLESIRGSLWKVSNALLAW